MEAAPNQKAASQALQSRDHHSSSGGAAAEEPGTAADMALRKESRRIQALEEVPTPRAATALRCREGYRSLAVAEKVSRPEGTRD